MSNNLGNFLDYLEDDTLTIPGIPSTQHPNGKTYTIPSPDAKLGARLAAVGDIAVKVGMGIEVGDREKERLQLDDDQELDLMQQLLGDTRQEMIDDGVTWTHLRGIMKYAFIYYALGPEQADNAARNGVLSGKAPAPANRVERRQGPKTPQARQDSGASRNRQGGQQRRRR